jgi:trans-2,3-dihydro-3-hydroxyanthranilate isomerase
LSHPLTWLDVFTSTPLRGNGLAVVHAADAVSDETMLAFARETQLSETTFVQSAQDAGADYANRIWTTGGEIPFAGHPSLGTAVAVAHLDGRRTASYVQETHAGLQPVEVELDGHQARASMLQGPAGMGAEAERATVAAAAGLGVGQLHPELPPQVVTTGQPHLMVPVRDAAVLDAVRPAFARFKPLMSLAGAMVLYLAAVEPGGRVSARGFFVGDGAVREDPATGSAAGPLCAYLHIRTGADRITIDQGVAMGRPSRLHCAVEGDRIRVGGDVVVVGTGTLLV